MSSPLEQLQSDVLAKLLSESMLSTINGKSLRKMQIASELDVSLVFMTPRTNKVGCGFVVGMPTLDVLHPDTPGPLLTLTLPVRVYEDPTQNLNPATGTLQSAETIAIIIQKLLHQFRILGLCATYAGKDSIHPVDSQPGTICYEVLARAELAQDIIPQVTVPTMTELNGAITLTPVGPSQDIYYTIDGSFPGKGEVPTATLYLAPFSVVTGTVVRWAGYSDNYGGSDADQATITF
jgi:hypothetical protein